MTDATGKPSDRRQKRGVAGQAGIASRCPAVLDISKLYSPDGDVHLRPGLHLRRRAPSSRSPTSTATPASLLFIAAIRSTRRWPNKWGDQWLGHVETIKPDYAKVLVVQQPHFDAAQREQQLGQLAQVSSGLHGIGVPLLYELLGARHRGPARPGRARPGARPRHPPRPGRAGDRRQPGARQRGFIHQSSASWRKTLLSIKLWLVLESVGKLVQLKRSSHTLRSRRR